MVEPLDIAIAVHELCEEELIPNGISPEHDVGMHSDTTSFYAQAINLAGLEVTGEDVLEALLSTTEWDRGSPWPGHPAPDLIIDYLKNKML